MQASIEIDPSTHRFMVRGELVFNTVPGLSKEGEVLMAEENELVFDFSQVAKSDSSGLALLTSWVRAANQLNKPICFINLPKQLLAVAKACRLDQLLPLGA